MKISAGSIVNDVGGTTELDSGLYNVKVVKSWHDYETGKRFIGKLTKTKDIQVATQKGKTGYTPADYTKYGIAMQSRVEEAVKAFDPSTVYFSEFDIVK